MKADGQVLAEALIALAAFLLFVTLTLQLCRTGLNETVRFRITREEKHGDQITRYKNFKKPSTEHDRDIHRVFHSDSLAR